MHLSALLRLTLSILCSFLFIFSTGSQSIADSTQIHRADKLLDEAIEIKNAGDTDLAIEKLVYVLKVLDSIPTKQFGIYADTYRQLGFAYKRKRNASRVIYYFDQGIQHFRNELFPGAAEDWIDVHNQIGVQYGMQYKLDSANMYFLAGIDSSRAWDVEYSVPTMSAYNNLVFSSSISGKRRKSIEYARESLRISKGMDGDVFEIAQAYAGLAIGFIENQAPALGKIYVDSSLVFAQRIEDPDLKHQIYCTDLGYMARLKFDSDEVHASRSFAIQALAHADSVTSFNISGRAYALTFLGKSQASLGDVQSAIQSLESAKQIYVHLGRDSDVAALDNIIATTWSRMGRHQEAMDNYKRSLDVYQTVSEKNNQKAGIVYMSMGRMATQMDDDLLAAKLYDTAFVHFYTDTVLNHEYIRDSWLSYGHLDNKQGLIASARAAFTKVIELGDPKAKSDDQTIRALIGLAKTFRMENKFFQSDSILQIAMERTGFVKPEDILQIEYPQLALDILESMGYSSYEEYKWHKTRDDVPASKIALAQALSSYNEAKEGLLTLEDEFLEDNSKLHLFEDHHNVYSRLVEISHEAFVTDIQDKNAWDILAICEENQRSLLSENIWIKEKSLQSPALAELLLEKALLIKEIADGRNDLLDAEQEDESQAELDSLANHIYNLVEEKQTAQSRIDSFKSSLHKLDLQFWTGPEIKKWSSNLEADTRILYYFAGYGEAFAFCVGPNDIKVLRIDSIYKVSEAISTIHDQLNIADQTHVKGFIDFLGEVLIEPFADDLEHAEHLIVIPGGELSTIPFEIFPDPMHNSEFLLNNFDLSYAGSIKLLDFQQNQKRKFHKSFLGIAPQYEDLPSNPGDSLFYPTYATLMRSGEVHLPGALEEVTAIAEIMDGDAITGTEATKIALNERAGDYEIIHLSMHALLDEKEPLNSKFVFDAHESAESALTAAELNTMDLGARMAVLSACNSGSGKIFKGEGAQSLSRSFMAAGVPTVVMSLWKVPDASTKQIMISFYENLAAGIPAHSALRNAKLTYLANAKTEIEKNPLYWAGFVLIGNPEPLVSPGGSWVIWLMGFTMLLILIAVWRKRKKSLSV